MDAFVTRVSSSSASPSKAGPSDSDSDSNSSRRLPPSTHIPSFYGNVKAKATATATTSKQNIKRGDVGIADKGKGRAIDVEDLPDAQDNPTWPLSNRPTNLLKRKLPPAHSGKLRQAVIEITKSLKSSDNPITHSTSYSSAFHYASCSTGHQRSNGRSRTADNEHAVSRNVKLKMQAAESSSSILGGVRAYINGVTTPLISNLDLIRLIQENGGEVKYNFSKRGCTHIICATGLSASKTHKELTKRTTTKVVTPQWVLDCIEQGKKLAETKYSTLRSETQASIKGSLLLPAESAPPDRKRARTANTTRMQSLGVEEEDEDSDSNDGDEPQAGGSRPRALAQPSSSAPPAATTNAKAGLGRNVSAISISDGECDGIVIISSSQ